MTFALAFWILMLIWLVFGAWHSGYLFVTGPNIILFLLILILGWKTFGSPLHG